MKHRPRTISCPETFRMQFARNPVHPPASQPANIPQPLDGQTLNDCLALPGQRPGAFGSFLDLLAVMDEAEE